MKKVSILLLVGVFILCGVGMAASPNEETSIDSLLQPYQEVIDRLNAEFGVNVYIPEDSKEDVYNNLREKSVDEFESELRGELTVEESKNDGASNAINQVFYEYAKDYITNLPVNEEVGKAMYAIPLGLQAERDDCIQTWWSDGISYIRLHSTVWSHTGSPGTFTYETINDVTSGWVPGSGQFFWVYEVSLANCSLNVARTICTVSGTRAKRNDDGLYLTVASSYSVPFYSSETN